jgi:hypothetical protein
MESICGLNRAADKARFSRANGERGNPKTTEERSGDERYLFSECGTRTKSELHFAEMRMNQSESGEMRQKRSAICREFFESFEQTERFAVHDFMEM